MFCHDKESIMEMFEISQSNHQFGHFLLITELCGEEAQSIGIREVITLHREWKHVVKQSLAETDAAYQINQGNIFVMVHHDHLVPFQQSVKDMYLASHQYAGGLRTCVLPLSQQETEFLLHLP